MDSYNHSCREMHHLYIAGKSNKDQIKKMLKASASKQDGSKGALQLKVINNSKEVKEKTNSLIMDPPFRRSK